MQGLVIQYADSNFTTTDVFTDPVFPTLPTVVSPSHSPSSPPLTDSSNHSPPIPIAHTSPPPSTMPVSPGPILRRSSQPRQPPQYLKDFHCTLATAAHSILASSTVLYFQVFILS